MPETHSGRKALSGALVILFLIPLIATLLSDMHADGKADWFGYVAGGLAVSYVILALPLWFQKPNPVIFVSCDFAVVALYLLYINMTLGADWFLSFAFPLIGGLCLITVAVITLVRYLKKGKLYIFGGACILMGGYLFLIEYLLRVTFGTDFIGWSIYPMATLVLFGCLLIYLAINRAAREVFERKLFF